LKLLLDANAFIWAYARPTELSPAARRALNDVANDRLVSIASLWEIAIKMSIGKLAFAENLTQALDDIAATSLPITLVHVARVRSLPFHHRDPFDRMMIAQAMEEGMTIVARDRRVVPYGVPVLMA
jgi:PIN domain nuclease of toxin-antitoxin system